MTPKIASRALPLARASREKKKFPATVAMTFARSCNSSWDIPSTPNGVNPARTSPTRAAVSTTTSTLLRPASVQYTSSRCRISANSSSTSPAPIPKTTAANADPNPYRPPATAPNPPMTVSTIPGTTWWMCTPPALTFPKGPLPARISRVITRVTTNVSTNEVSARSSGSLPGSTMLRCHQSPICARYGDTPAVVVPLALFRPGVRGLSPG
ncbi:hypothetical protein BZZ08_07372 [Streptomyces sp. MH60]|nr:hypothetical protein BZZ08_07372 [Streptomyces sp. MH60]